MIELYYIHRSDSNSSTVWSNLLFSLFKCHYNIRKKKLVPMKQVFAYNFPGTCWVFGRVTVSLHRNNTF